jgi:hypothetical protein
LARLVAPASLIACFFFGFDLLPTHKGCGGIASAFMKENDAFRRKPTTIC